MKHEKMKWNELTQAQKELLTTDTVNSYRPPLRRKIAECIAEGWFALHNEEQQKALLQELEREVQTWN